MGGLTSTVIVRHDRVGDFVLHAREFGEAGAHDAPVIVLVHGLVVSSRYMVPTARLLAPHHRVLAPDLPGFGGSDTAQPALDVPALARVLGQWLDALSLRRVVLVGNSLGCQVVAHHAARDAGRIESVVLSAPTMDAAARSPLAQIGRLALTVPRESPSLVPIFLRDFVDAGVRRTWSTFRHGLAHRIEDDLPRIDVPTLIVRGEHDPIVPAAWAQSLVRSLPQGRLREIEGGAHANNYSDAVAFAALVAEHMRGSAR